MDKKPIDRKQLIKLYLDYFKSKNHKEIPNHSLIPDNDPTVLFTTAGMHPLVPYLLGQSHPLGKRLVNVQRCIRTVDFDNIGDTYHHTFFEMLGNWSLGDYWKEEAIKMTFEFLTKILKIPAKRLAATCFIGDKDALKDDESKEVYIQLGFPKERIAFLDKKSNFWGPAGKTGPCGPNTEIFYWKLNDKSPPKTFDPDNENWLEIGNNVLLAYDKNESGKFDELKQKNIDFGGGVERIITTLNGFEDNYLSDMWFPIIKEIEKLSNKHYKGNEKSFRIIADHIKASVFIIADGIIPSNTEQGYILRRLIRRAVRYGRELNLKNFMKKIAEPIFNIYNDYEILKKNKHKILNELEKEEIKFLETLENGIKEFEKITKNKKQISGKESFLLYQSYGFPFDITKELSKEKNISVSEEEFNKELKKHQELSRTATEGKFKSGLSDNSEATTKLHTATHLLLAALKKVLKNKDIHQRGSNITPERLRLDFSFDRRLTEEELKEVEKIVNQKIVESIPIVCEKMTPEEAKKQGAEGVFENKYSDIVTVYSAGNFSKEICAGPHVKNTDELKNFKILKEEASSAGVRRIKAVLD
ncbi:MAG: alanine--tRNA ligase [Candidatus Nanoarchaeia archaeon]|nr:alanine--tRNA ligase [Candidatus Nanoarchaeia archaeon]